MNKRIKKHLIVDEADYGAHRPNQSKLLLESYKRNKSNSKVLLMIPKSLKNQEEKISPFVKDLSLLYDTNQQGWSYSQNPNSISTTFEIYWTGEILSSYNFKGPLKIRGLFTFC